VGTSLPTGDGGKSRRGSSRLPVRVTDAEVPTPTHGVGSRRLTGFSVGLFVTDESMGASLESVFCTKGYRVFRTLEAHQSEKRPTVVVTDLGVDPAKRIQEITLLKGSLGNPPILCVASLGDREVILQGLQVGIDDFVFRPLRIAELETRLDLLLARRGLAPTSALPSILERRRRERRRAGDTVASVRGPPGTPDLRIDDRLKQVRVHGKVIPLSPREYQLLHLLASEPGRVFSVEEIIHRLWPPNSKATANDVQQFIHLLRRKLEGHPPARRENSAILQTPVPAGPTRE
jgi:DNA-binding response OmpR family regulator